jgi:hypothetical protein
MRDFIFLTVLAVGALWAYDEYKYDGRNREAAWQQARVEGRNFSSQVHGLIDNAMSGR